jgi:hypothetical protein
MVRRRRLAVQTGGAVALQHQMRSLTLSNSLPGLTILPQLSHLQLGWRRLGRLSRQTSPVQLAQRSCHVACSLVGLLDLIQHPLLDSLLGLVRLKVARRCYASLLAIRRDAEANRSIGIPVWGLRCALGFRRLALLFRNPVLDFAAGLGHLTASCECRGAWRKGSTRRCLEVKGRSSAVSRK